MKKWTVSRADAARVNRIRTSTDLPPLLAEVMAARGYNTAESLAAFFNGEELSDPFLLADMDKAVDAINAAVENGEKICIFGDYDCDGVTSSAILYGYLMSMGADVSVMLPEREGGYGLSISAVEKMHNSGVSLIVTVDNGISAIEEAKRIAELGMSLVVTDHHQPLEVLPEALAVVDPHRPGCLSPFKMLCGAGVVLKLCAALDGGDYGTVCEQYLDLAAIATVADVVPLIGENRVIVSSGLRLLKNTENVGLLSLLEQCGTSPEAVNSTALAYTIAPRINASSRFGSPMTAFNMLTAEDESAAGYAAELIRLNSMRKTAEGGVMGEIAAMIDSDPKLLEGRVLTVAERGWHSGVIGIVAARLVEMYEKPALVISIGDGGLARGSARSVEGFNVFKCFDHCRELLIKYGGHELAGGLTVSEDNIPALREKIESYALEFHCAMPRATLNADKLLTGADLTFDNAAALSRAEPFGQGNPEPLFAVSGAVIKAVYPLKNGEYTKLDLSLDDVSASALFFKEKTADFPLKVGDRIDLMANMLPNEYKGNRSVSLKAVDYRLHGVKQDRFFAACDVYEKFRRGEKVEKRLLEKGLPDRAELVGVYKYIAGSASPLTFESLYARVQSDSLNAFKLRIMIDAFADTGLLKYSPSSGRIEPSAPKSRVDIETSETLKKLRAMIL